MFLLIHFQAIIRTRAHQELLILQLLSEQWLIKDGTLTVAPCTILPTTCRPESWKLVNTQVINCYMLVMVISHISYTCLHISCYSVLHLKDVLCVPHLTKNLISVSKLFEDNNITIELLANMCFMKDKKKEIHLVQGIARCGLSQFLSKNEFVFIPVVSDMYVALCFLFSIIQLVIFLIQL